MYPRALCSAGPWPRGWRCAKIRPPNGPCCRFWRCLPTSRPIRLYWRWWQRVWWLWTSGCLPTTAISRPICSPAPGSAWPVLPHRWQFTICGMCAMWAGWSAAAPVIPASARRAPRCPPSWSTASRSCWGSPSKAFTPSARPSSALRWPTWATSSGPATAS